MSSSSSTTKSLFVSCPAHFEELLLEEIIELGIEGAKKDRSGVFVPHSMDAVFKLCYLSRIATRVMLPLATFRTRSREDLYRGASKIDWTGYVTPKQTLSIDSNVFDNFTFKNSLFAAQVVKDAICDVQRGKWNDRSIIDTKTPDVQVNLFIDGQDTTISLDLSGEPLYKRGWRKVTVDAPLQETLAAALLRKAKYSGEERLLDPFCGSGTFLVEAAMIATNTPAGFYRKQWGFFHLPEFNQSLWQQFKAEQDGKRTKLPKGKILGMDVDPKSFDTCYANLRSSGFDESIELILRDVRKFRHPFQPSLIVTNPPYGMRLDLEEDVLFSLRDLIQNKKAKGCVLLPEETMELLPTATSIFSCFNGGIKVHLLEIV